MKLAYSRPLKGKWKITAFVECERTGQRDRRQSDRQRALCDDGLRGRGVRVLKALVAAAVAMLGLTQVAPAAAPTTVGGDDIHLELSPRICTLRESRQAVPDRGSRAVERTARGVRYVW